MSLSEIVQVNITADTVTPDRAGFGVPMLAAYFPPTIFADLSREYSTSAEMVTDGFPTGHPAVRMAQRIESQSPRPSTFKVGRRATPFDQEFRVIPTITTQGLIVGLDVLSPNGVTLTEIRYTNGPAETVATIVTALTALLNPIVGLTAVDNVTAVACSADTTGDLFELRNFLGGVTILDTTADPGIVANLTAIRADDSDWYGLSIDSNSEAQAAALAAWAETEVILFGVDSGDEEVATDAVGNLAETLEAAAYNRTFLLFNRALGRYGATAWFGDRLSADPGSATWAMKTLAGIVADSLTTTQRTNIESNNANHYTRRAGIDITRQGTLASGRFIDVQRTIDAVTARIQEEVFDLLTSLEKVPYTDAGVGLVIAAVLGVLREFQQTGALDPAIDPVVTAPRVADVSAADKTARILPDVRFQATLAGAIHRVEIDGVLAI